MKYTLCFIFSTDMKYVLMATKNRGPFSGHLNGVGGKIEEYDINPLSGMIREIAEETGLEPVDYENLKFLVKMTYADDTELNVYYTKLKEKGPGPQQIEDEELHWYRVKDLDVVNIPILAGNGNIPYFIRFALDCEEEAKTFQTKPLTVF